MFRVRLSAYFTLAMLVILLNAPLHAKNGTLLPQPPSGDIIDQVIAQTGGPTYTALKTPKNIKQSLKTFGQPFEGIHQWVSKKDAISYIATGGVIKEVVLPLKDSGSQLLEPNMTAPGLVQQPGKVVGAVYQPLRGTMALVVTFKANNKPDKIRMYYTNTDYYEYAIEKDKFSKHPSGTLDEGAILSYNLSCVTVGSHQICWQVDVNSGVREGIYPGEQIAAAYERAKTNYDLKTKFFIDDAVPDLIGNLTRANCAAALETADLLNGAEAPALAACDPNLYVSASQAKKDDEPIAIWVVDAIAELKAYTYEGAFVGYVPVGEYLVVNVTPQTTTPGDIGVLMLVNINSDQHYLIPSIRIQQFADKKKPKPQVAAIKDGATWYYGW